MTEVTDAMVEAAARAMFDLLKAGDGPWSLAQGSTPDWVTLDGGFDFWLLARASVEAAFAVGRKQAIERQVDRRMDQP